MGPYYPGPGPVPYYPGYPPPPSSPYTYGQPVGGAYAPYPPPGGGATYYYTQQPQMAPYGQQMPQRSGGQYTSRDMGMMATLMALLCCCMNTDVDIDV